jgi:hypothetical protein
MARACEFYVEQIDKGPFRGWVRFVCLCGWVTAPGHTPGEVVDRATRIHGYPHLNDPRTYQ